MTANPAIERTSQREVCNAEIVRGYRSNDYQLTACVPT